MISAFLIGSALVLAQAGVFAQAGAPSGLPESTLPDSIQTRDVAFETLAAGHTEEAIGRIEQLLTQRPDDPALLINLGAAYLQQGDYRRAEDAYRRAVESDERYRLELADGSWVDSRRAARRALEALEGTALAAR